MSLVIFILVLSVLVIVHEWGHFITAKSLGVKVEKFSIGFGKKLFSRMHKGTEFIVSAVPLGGYVKMAGDERAACTGSPEEFFSHPIWHRALIVVMGPVINFIFAYVCFYVICVTGFPMLTPTVGKVMEGYPAQVAGLQKGDHILKINAEEIESWDALQQNVMKAEGESLHLTILRDNREIVKTIEPQEKKVKNIFGQEEQVWIIGIQPQGEITFLRYGVGGSFLKAFEQLRDVTVLTYKALYHVITGTMSAKEALAGPIRIFDVVKEAARMGLSYLISIMAIISASLAIVNLFPIPVLDGGHLFLLGLEGIRRKPLPLKIEEGLTRAGFSLLMCLMIFVLYNDIVQVGWVDNVKDFIRDIRKP